MSSYRPLRAIPVVFLIVLAGCGSGSFNPNNVTLTISPAAATIPTNGQVTLQAILKNNCPGCMGPIQSWTIAENPSGANCTTFVGIVPSGPCPAGTIQIPVTSLTVIYVAPNTPGTNHITAEWDAFDNFNGPPTVTKDATSVITVSP
jgi:hypothetical protein